MRTTEENQVDCLIREAGKLRGHICFGLPLGVKMGLEGLRVLRSDGKLDGDNLMVVVENNKCPVDGIQVATGCTAGSRRLKVLDLGKSAAVFYDGSSGIGYRIKTKPDLRKRALKLGVEDGLISEGQRVQELSGLDRRIMANAFTKMTQEELFDHEKVRVNEGFLMQRSHRPRTVCSRCGEEIMSGKGIRVGRKVMCENCLNGPYFLVLRPSPSRKGSHHPRTRAGHTKPKD